MKFLPLAAFAIAIAAPAQAADIPVKAAPPPVVAVYNWTGFYLGVHVGGAFGTSVQTFFDPVGPASGTTDRYDISGIAGGGTAGYNFQFSNFVIGVEADISAADISGRSSNLNPSYNCGLVCETDVRWFATLRGRAGFAFNNWFIYGTGGWAYANIKSNLNGGIEDHNRSGWTAGGGIEYGFLPNWSFKIEYLHFHFDSYVWTNANNTFFTCTGINCSTDARFGVIRGGVNFRWGGAAPVIARY